uniref:Uncharacterized protein n=1 Tax=Brassica oleracea TaxID=3712 RepID=A0A3P6DEZ4_BRAOL|nr:unnamed protein product [Brassica oleracea]
MAKNLSSITFTVLLLVLLMASTGITLMKFSIMLCSSVTGSNNDCCHCCLAKYGREAV